MKNARVSGAPVGETVIDFLRGAVERYGSRDALLFKPAFRYQRWSYSRLWNESGRDPSPAPGPDNGGPSHPVGTGCSFSSGVSGRESYWSPWTFAARTTFPGSYPGQNRNWRSRRGSLRRTRLSPRNYLRGVVNPLSMSSDYVRLSGQGKCPSRPLSYDRTVMRGTCPWCASWAGSWLRRTCGPCPCGCPTPWRLPEWRGPEA